jgi:hypothetical protein
MAPDFVTEPQDRIRSGRATSRRLRQSRHARSQIVALRVPIGEDEALKGEGSLT